MKTLRSAAFGLFFAVAFVASALAQTTTPPVAPAGPAKIAVINTFLFDDATNGIKKYVSAMNTLETEFKPVQTNLEGMNTKLQGLAKEIQGFRDAAARPNAPPVNTASVNAKVEEAEKLQRDLKFQQEDAKARFERRQQALVAPVMQDIYKAVQEFAKAKGYTMILDIAKMDQAGIIMALDGNADVTKDFITFYNARPATTATTTAPR
jgi:Skp family chaperone for outer membrane proteins